METSVNNKCRAFTSLEQSKKLAEILPLESADMFYNEEPEDETYPKDIVDTEYPMILKEGHIHFLEEYGIPCWSLAALLSVLPKNLNIGRPSLESNYMGYYWIQYYDEFMKPNNYKTECFNNPVNACYEMIMRLHELNLL